MKIIIAGYGKMGHEIEKVALERGHQVVAVYDSETKWGKEVLPHCDVVIDFSTPVIAPDVVNRCLDLNIPVLSGTTGWNDKVIEAIDKANNEGKTFFYASNFSIGVNIFFELNKKLALFLCDRKQYNAAIHEIHHIHKKDAPSGTAITIAQDIIKECTRYKKWVLSDEKEQTIAPDELNITSERTGEVPGTHNIKWESGIDTIELKHTAHSRAGFAYGAIYAAEWMQGRRGVFGMSDLLQLGE